LFGMIASTIWSVGAFLLPCDYDHIAEEERGKVPWEDSR